MTMKEVLGKHKKQVFFLLLLIALGVIASSINPAIYGGVIDSITNLEREKFELCLVLFLCIQIFTQLLSVLETYIGQLTATRIENEIKNHLFKRILRFKCSALDSYMEGELMNRLEFDAEAIVGYYIEIVSNSISIICNFVISLFFIVNISKRLTVIAIIMIPILYLINFLSRGRIRLLQKIKKGFEDKYFSFVNETLGNLQNLKIFHLGKRYAKKYEEFLEQNYKIEKKRVVFTGIVGAVRSIVSNLFDILIIYVSAMIIFAGGMTVGSMVAFNTYLAQLFDAIEKILEINMNKQSMEVNRNRILKLYEEPIEEQEEREEVVSEVKTIRVENVSFAYGKEDVLKNIDLSIDTAGLYSIKGENGSGKTTLLKLLIGLYPCDRGKIFLNDIPLEKLSLENVREQIAYLGKEPFLVNGTIRENICIGKEIEEGKVQKACEAVCLYEDVMAFEKGYDTEIGENGSKLSSGQKQKLALARMLIQEKSVILLDEAMSAVDMQAKEQIATLLKDLKKNKIIIFVSHDIETLIEPEKVFVLDKN